MSYDLNELVSRTVTWADDKGITDPALAHQQALKMVSEVGEFVDEVLKGDPEKQQMELGDVLVTLIATSECLGHDLSTCLNMALEKITKRTGKTVNGVFVKD